jgi:hypothetical protein
MMAANPDLPALLAPVVDGIPASLLDSPRWAPWRAEWNPGKKKYEKIPHRADRPSAGLSNKSTQGWSPFHKAMAVYLSDPERFAGVGYLMTGEKVAGGGPSEFHPHNITAIDLDHCVKGGVVDPWAAEVVAKLDSYTEISPSGNGLRVMLVGSVARDWVNHERGIEVYGGTAARFVTITGQRVAGSPPTIRAARAGALDAIAARYRKAATSAQVVDLHLPALVPDMLLPDIDDLDLPTHARNFLLDGPAAGDRSRQLFAASIALQRAGLEPDVMLSLLEANEHAMEVALDHRRQDYDKALRYLWKDHCKAGEARSKELRQLDLSQFDDMTPGEAAGDSPRAAEPEMPAAEDHQAAATGAGSVADDFEDMGADEKRAEPRPANAAPAKRARFSLVAPEEFLRRAPPNWIIREVLPRAGLAVIYGDSGSGKTFFTLDLVAAVARGGEWRGKAVAKGRGIYIVAEGAGGFRNRLEAYCAQHDVDPASLDIRFITDAPNLLDKADIRELLISILGYGRVDFIVIDTYARAMAGANENDAKDVGQAVAHCDAIHRKTGALVVLVHHSGKDVNKGARGSGALRAAADVEISVTKTREYRAASITKMKDGGDAAEFQFRLSEVALGQDQDGFPRTSCVVEHRDNQPRRAAPGRALTPMQQMVLATLDTANDFGDAGMHLADLQRLVADQIPRQEGKETDNRRRDAMRAIDSLLKIACLDQDDKGYIRVSEAPKV